MTIRDVKEMHKPNWVPRLRTKEELAIDCKYKRTWRGGSNKNDFFSQTSINKPKDLNSWEIDRCFMLPRRYDKNCFSKFPPSPINLRRINPIMELAKTLS